MGVGVGVGVGVGPARDPIIIMNVTNITMLDRICILTKCVTFVTFATAHGARDGSPPDPRAYRKRPILTLTLIVPVPVPVL